MQRPMSTRSGVPTAAAYVSVNRINKLRREFRPEFFDVSAPAYESHRKWNLDTGKMNYS